MGKGIAKNFKHYKIYRAMVQRSLIPKMGAMGTGGASGATDIANLLLGVKYRRSKFLRKGGEKEAKMLERKEFLS